MHMYSDTLMSLKFKYILYTHLYAFLYYYLSKLFPRKFLISKCKLIIYALNTYFVFILPK